jgi:hypothetical protein
VWSPGLPAWAHPPSRANLRVVRLVITHDEPADPGAGFAAGSVLAGYTREHGRLARRRGTGRG